MQVTGTPTLVVNGKYRMNNEHLKSREQIIDLVKFLVAKESSRRPRRRRHRRRRRRP